MSMISALQGRFYSFACWLFSFNFSTKDQPTSANGAICATYSAALALLACLRAYLATMPCMMTASRNIAKAMPQSISLAGSHSATSQYHCRHCCLVGKPNVASVWKATLPRPISSATGDWASVNGMSRLAKSERGWPMVDISQLRSDVSDATACGSRISIL